MRKFRIALIVLLAIILLGCFVACAYFAGEGIVSHDIKKYDKITNTYNFLPKIDDIKNYNNIEFTNLHKTSIIFESNGYLLKISYNEDEFLKQKKHIENSYIFQENLLVDDILITEPLHFNHDGFDFSILSFEEYGFTYPKNIVFIGINNETKQIAYIVFEDQDLDIIDDPFAKFIEQECGWNR